MGETYPWPPRGTPINEDRMLLSGWTRVMLSPNQVPGLSTTCCSSDEFYIRRRGHRLTVRCAACGGDRIMQAWTFETGESDG